MKKVFAKFNDIEAYFHSIGKNHKLQNQVQEIIIIVIYFLLGSHWSMGHPWNFPLHFSILI
jgi:hypothetical protein